MTLLKHSGHRLGAMEDQLVEDRGIALGCVSHAGLPAALSKMLIEVTVVENQAAIA